MDQRLKLETLRRGANGALAQIILLVFMMAFTPTFPYSKPYHIVGTFLILIFAFRWFIFKAFKDQPTTLVSHYEWSLHLGVSTSIFWAIFNGLAIWHFHLKHPVALIHIFVTNGLLAAVMYSLLPTPRFQKTYILILGSTISLILFINEVGMDRYASGPMLVFSLYLALASRGHSHDLRSAYEFENRLIEENEKLQDVVDSVPGFMILVSSNGQWLHSSKSMGELTHSKEIKEEITQFLSSQAKTKTKEIELSSSIGEKSYMLTLEKRTSGGTVVLGLPIGEIKKMRNELEAQKTKAEYSARLAALGEMAGGVAHEINNPLAVITMSADLLRNRLRNSLVNEEIWKSHTDKINDTVKRIALIVKSLQNLSRETDGVESEEINLTQIVDETLNICRERFRIREITIDYHHPGDLWVKGRRVEIGQVLINLINNAYDAVKDSPIKRVTIDFKEHGEKVLLQIQDTGYGVPESIQEKLFQPFFTTKPFGEGSGLGLSISRSLLLKFGGEVSLIKTHNPTIFQVSLQKSGFIN